MKAGLALKRLHRKSGRNGSLKAFVRTLKGDEEELARVWLLNKSPAEDRRKKAERWKRKGAVILAQRAASRNARQRGGKGDSGRKPEPAAGAKK